MKKTVLFLLVIMSIFISSCSMVSNENTKILVSILPQQEFIKAIGGDLVDVNVLIPPGGSPATYSPTAKELVNVQNAQVYFRIGHIPFEEEYVSRFQELNPSLKIIDTSENIDLLYFDSEHTHEEHAHEEEENFVDPHVWLSPKRVKKQVELIYDELVKVLPESNDYLTQNKNQYIESLDSLDLYLQNVFNNLSVKKILVFHPSWGYLADDYGFEQIAIEEMGKDATAESLSVVVDMAKAENIKFIIVQEQFNKEIAASIAQEIDGEVINLDPLAPNYVENMKNIGETISKNLK